MMGTRIAVVVLVLGSVAVCLVSSTATGQAGFVNVDTVRNGLTMISVPLHTRDKNLNGTPGCVGDMIKQNLTGGAGFSAADVIYRWDPSIQDYEYAFLVKAPGSPYDGRWFDAKAGHLSSLTFDVGEAFWIFRRDTGSNPATITFFGSAPIEPTISITFVQGLTMFSYPYPITLALNDSTLKPFCWWCWWDPGLSGDVVYKWDAAAQNYVYAFFVNAPGTPYDGKWFDPVGAKLSDITFEPGVGLWYFKRTAGTAEWICRRPY